MSVWIGEIQWMRRNGFAEARDPVLKPLNTIECRDAILTADSTEPEWPAADVVIGNPPFLGGKLLITHLGEEYVSRMFATYDGRVPAEADLVCYWFEKAGRQIAWGPSGARAGLVATNSIRGGANRRALQAATAGAADLRGVERRAMGDRWRGGAGVAGLLLARRCRVRIRRSGSMASPSTRSTRT